MTANLEFSHSDKWDNHCMCSTCLQTTRNSPHHFLLYSSLPRGEGSSHVNLFLQSYTTRSPKAEVPLVFRLCQLGPWRDIDLNTRWDVHAAQGTATAQLSLLPGKRHGDD
ncbi:hypothetical protein E2C01_021273 [Portunus trituberculatus]|uniref:Uncharacterized protein n=1 Tax=Portunus trituberculatus TaxID=210409 RepID=A0A5B7E296_PORTR|nr:hypothetical protein [Portunus trituberculatus]